MLPSWVSWVGRSLKIGLLISLVYVGVVFYQRWSRSPLQPEKKEEVNLHEDMYVHPKKSYVTDAESARGLIGDRLWVREGYRWTCEPCDEPLKPLEKVTPTGVRESGDQVLLEFRRDGKLVTLPIGKGGRMFVDNIFFIEDPQTLYDHWDAETWRKIENHEVETGMSEFQITFALGAGRLARTSPGGQTRVVDYTARQAAGLDPIRVTYRDHVALRIEKLPPQPQ